MDSIHQCHVVTTMMRLIQGMLMAPTMVFLCLLVLTACSQEQQEEYSKQMVINTLPKGAQLLEHVSSVSDGGGIYTIYKFRGQCFLKHNGGYHEESMVGVDCP